MTHRRRWAALVAVALLGLGAVVMRRPTTNMVVSSLATSAVPVAAAIDPYTGRAVVVTRATRTAPGAVLMLDARSGRLVRSDAGQGDAVAIDARTGRAFVAASDPNGNGSVRSISMQSGIVLRTTALTITTVPVPIAVAEQAGRVFIGNGAPYCCSPGTVSVVDAPSGRLLRTVAVGMGPSAIVVD